MKKNYEDYLTLVIEGELKKRIRIVSAMQGRSINNWFNETVGPLLAKIVDEEFNRVTTKIVNDKEKAEKARKQQPTEAQQPTQTTPA
jgi:hypothetical protein